VAVLGQHAEHPLALANLGLVAQAEGEHEQALALFDQHARLDPGSVATQFNRAVSLQALGRFDEARAALQAVLALEPRWTAARQRLDALPPADGDR
jgi:tetratricopeptide (TPR) repeat protein